MTEQRSLTPAVASGEETVAAWKRNAERLRLGCIRPLLADAAQLVAQRPDWQGSFDRVSVGFPGVVVRGVVRSPKAESGTGVSLAARRRPTPRAPPSR